MARTPITLLLLRRLTLTSKTQKPSLSSFVVSHKPYSSSSSFPDPTSPTSLSARMSFVFDQIDAIERERADKDKTLQRIRAWRQSKNNQQQQEQTRDEFITDQQIPEGIGQSPEVISSKDEELESGVCGNGVRDLNLTESDSVGKVVEVVHPWPEWIELMERLVKQNYFDCKRKDEDKMLKDLGFDTSDAVNGNADNSSFDFGGDFLRDFKTVQTACLNFGKDRFDILRSLSRQDIQILTGHGCPSADKKVVFSSKLLRKHAHLDEGDVCSNCSLRTSCERAFLLTNKEDEARTIDAMRVLHTYGFDAINESVTNKPLMKKKSVKTVVRKLLHEVVKLSAIPIDPNLPPPVIKKPPPKVKQPPPPPKKRVGRDDVEMKKGDWLCPKCDFMNFAKNTVCLQCDAKRPKRQLLPGEWECPQCNFLNYRRNTACFHCDCKRPPDEFVESKMDERHYGHKTRLEKITKREEVSNAWNFDFDDNESDGADVAAFEYADTASRGVDSTYSNQFQGANLRGHNNDHNDTSRNQMGRERDFSDRETSRRGIGFDDFDDFDDVDSYELDTENRGLVQNTYRGNSFDKKTPDLQDFGDSDDDLYTDLKTSSRSFKKPSKPKHQKASFSISDDEEADFDSDEELAVHPQWKSSHVAGARNTIRGRSPTKGLSFGSDEELDGHSGEEDDFGNDYGKGKRKNMGFSGRNNRRSSDWDESDNNDIATRGTRSRRNQNDSRKRVNNFRHQGDFNGLDAEFGGRNRRSQRNDRSEFRRNGRGSDRRSFGGRNRDGFQNRERRGSDRQSFGGPNRDGFQNRERGRSRDYTRDMDSDFGEFRNSRRVIER